MTAAELSKQEAQAICGTLSKTAKMPCPGYSLPAQHCRLGSFLREIPGAICAHCYALRGRYVFPVVRNAMAKRLASISDPRWVDAITTLIRRSRSRYFRWHDSGDIQSIRHLENIIAVCTSLPGVKFWLPTREYQTVEAYRRMGGTIPMNLCIRYSAHLVNGRPPLRYGMPTSAVSSHKSEVQPTAFPCPASHKGNKCGRCRACWDPTVKIIDFPLKWPGRSKRRGIVP